jgi:DNA-binding NtrC family response regulator
MDAAMCRILVVDDDEGLLSIIREYLSAYGFEPELAGNATQARHCLKRSKYDAVLSDFQMPGESGLDLLRHVKSRYPGLPFILMTGSHKSQLNHDAIKMSTDAYLEKPFGLQDLIKTIAAVLPPADQGTQKLAS